MPVPPFAFAENSAFRSIRGLKGDRLSWGEMIAVAQSCIGFFQEHEGEPDLLYEEPAAQPLLAAARILESASKASSDADEPARSRLRMLAACAYAMFGNFVSSGAVLRENPLVAVGDECDAVLGTIAPTLVSQLLGAQLAAPSRAYLEALESASLGVGDWGTVTALFRSMLPGETPWSGALLRSARLALLHQEKLSVRTALAGLNQSFAEEYGRRLHGCGLKVLLPPQYKLLQRGLLRTRENSLVALPTSSGKTLLAELCLLHTLDSGSAAACYIAPYVALGRQVVESLRAHLPPAVRVVPMIGGYEPQSLASFAGPQIVVATPERLDGLLRVDASFLARLRCVIADEAHVLENDARGARLEGILTRLRLIQLRRPQAFRMVLLSAVLTSYERLGKWLGIDDERIFIDHWRPTARRLAIWQQTGTLRWFTASDPIRLPAATNRSVIGEKDLPWPNPRFYPAQNIGQVRAQEPLADANVAFLVDHLRSEIGSPILCVCSTKGRTRDLAQSIASRFPSTALLPQRTSALVQLIEQKYSYLRSLLEVVKCGVAYHNASLPHEVRRGIEDAVRAREIIAVASTTTLAEGVDLPFRVTVLADWLVWRDQAQFPMPSLLFRNIAGRCGRAGVFTEGDTIIFDNPVGPADKTRSYFRQEYFLTDFVDGRPSVLQSPLVEVGNREGVRAALESQFLAAIPENADVDDLGERFAAYTYAATGGQNAIVERELAHVRDALLDEGEGAFARAASPLRLTALGQDANKTGFSPGSVRKILKALRDLPSSTSILPAAMHMLEQTVSCAEQPSNDLRKILSGARNRNDVKREDLPEILRSWTSGEDEADIFSNLPTTMRSKVSPSVEAWRMGSSEKSSWDGRYEKFLDLLSAINEFLPWVLRAAAVMTPHVTSGVDETRLRAWATLLEWGASTAWAVEALKNDAPGQRRFVVRLGELWPSSPVGDPLGFSAVKHDPAYRAAVAAALSQTRQLATDDAGKHTVEALRQWIERQTATTLH